MNWLMTRNNLGNFRPLHALSESDAAQVFNDLISWARTKGAALRLRLQDLAIGPKSRGGSSCSECFAA
jgi:hypothetical protein